MLAPCEPWEALWPCDVTCLSPTVTGSAVEFATDIIWALSGRRFGFCTVTLRPCRRECLEAPWGSAWGGWWPGSAWVTPVLHGGQWFNMLCGGCGDNCSCTSLSEVVLPGYVDSIIEVKIDGTPMATGSYRVDDHRLLVRTDGGSWPYCNDLTKDDTQVGTWSVKARYGEAPPESGKWAVGDLACELSRAMVGEDCRLPRNLTQLARQGVTLTFPDVTELFRERRTGLYLADLFIAAFNPHGLARRAKTYSIDHPQHRVAGL